MQVAGGDMGCKGVDEAKHILLIQPIIAIHLGTSNAWTSLVDAQRGSLIGGHYCYGCDGCDGIGLLILLLCWVGFIGFIGATS